MSPGRGEAWWADIPGVGEKPVLVVSRDVLNAALREVTVARITAVERERSLPTYVMVERGELADLEARSFVLCHNLFTLPKDSLRRPAGEMPLHRLLEVEDALRFALDLEPTS